MDEGKTASEIIEDIQVLKAISWLQTAGKSVSTETINHCSKKCGCDAGDKSIINEEIDTEFQELFVQISSYTTTDEYTDFDVETITSELAVDPTHVDWRQECREKNIAEVLQSEDNILIYDSDDEIPDDEQDVRKVTASEAFDSLDAVKSFAEIHGDKQMNVMLNELIGKVETLKLQNLIQSTIRYVFLRNEVVSYHN